VYMRESLIYVAVGWLTGLPCADRSSSRLSHSDTVFISTDLD
jgi:hypothetical protein